MQPDEILKKIGLSPTEIEIYMALLAQGALRASEIVKVVRGKRPTVYYALRQLKDRGLVHAVPSGATTTFQAEPAERLLDTLAMKRDEVQTLMDEVKSALPAFQKTVGSRDGVPSVSFYEGEHAMKQAIMDTLYCASRHIDSLAPHDNFFWQVGQEFSQGYINARVSRNITTRNLWERPLKEDILTRSYKGLSQIRLLPVSVHGQFRTAMFLYDDKVMYISSLASGYILLVQSKEHFELMKTMYDALWEVSEGV